VGTLDRGWARCGAGSSRFLRRGASTRRGELAAALGVTDNAVRTHLSSRAGEVGGERDGKPAGDRRRKPCDHVRRVADEAVPSALERLRSGARAKSHPGAGRAHTHRNSGRALPRSTADGSVGQEAGSNGGSLGRSRPQTFPCAAAPALLVGLRDRQSCELPSDAYLLPRPLPCPMAAVYESRAARLSTVEEIARQRDSVGVPRAPN
jgi:hypothetical protein